MRTTLSLCRIAVKCNLKQILLLNDAVVVAGDDKKDYFSKEICQLVEGQGLAISSFCLKTDCQEGKNDNEFSFLFFVFFGFNSFYKIHLFNANFLQVKINSLKKIFTG